MDKDTNLYHVVVDLIAATSSLHIALQRLNQRVGGADELAEKNLAAANEMITSAVRHMRDAIDRELSQK